MDVISYSEARKNFPQTMNRVCADHMPLVITRPKDDPVVMISLEDYNAIEETLYLLRSPRNAQRLFKALHDVEKGKFFQKDLVEDL